MLSLFPELLYLSPIAAFLLRIAVGLSFIGIAWKMLPARAAMATVPLPVIGRPPVFLMTLTALSIGGIGLMFVLGFLTQLAALLGIATVVVRIALGRRYDAVCPYIFSTYALLFVMCLSLLVMGAGPLAFDLPL